MYEILIIIILLLLNGFLAMSEIAFVSARRFKLEEKAKKGNTRAKKALLLLSEPEKFLSAVQIGITLVGILAGAFGGYALAEDLKPYLDNIGFIKPYSGEVSFAVIVTIITYFSLVIGELVPKSIALNNPERIAVFSAPVMYALTKIFSPVVAFLSVSTKVFLFFLKSGKNTEPPVTEEELKSLLELGTRHGTFEKEESEIINRIFSFNDKKVSSVMIPRTDIEWIDSSLPNDQIFSFITSHKFSRYPVCENDIDNPAGYLDSKDFLKKYYAEPSFNLKSIISSILIVPESMYSFDLLEKFRTGRTNIAWVIDEHGGTQGLITLHDIIENILGELPEKFENAGPDIILRSDGTFLVDGSTDIMKISDHFSVEVNPGQYDTLGGLIMARLGRIPTEGDTVVLGEYRFEVIDMDGRRVDKLLVKKI